MIKDKSIFIKNVYYMLSYAFTTLNQGGYEDVATEEFENMHNLFAAILAKGNQQTVEAGPIPGVFEPERGCCCSPGQDRHAGDHSEPPCQKAGADLRVR